MKKKLLSSVFFLAFINLAFAQNINKYIEWLNENTHMIETVNCPSKEFSGNNIIFDKNGIILTNNGDENCMINWNDIDQISLIDDFLCIFSNEYVGNRSDILKFYIKDEQDVVYIKHRLNKIAQAKSKYYKNEI